LQEVSAWFGLRRDERAAAGYLGAVLQPSFFAWSSCAVQCPRQSSVGADLVLLMMLPRPLWCSRLKMRSAYGHAMVLMGKRGWPVMLVDASGASGMGAGC
jgi:hypothetical protein